MKEVQNIYDNLAETYIRQSAESPYNAYYERPAMVKLLGNDLAGKCILDVGSASGYYIDHFLSAGATVTGVDISGEMTKRLQARLGGRAQIYRADISQENPFPEAPQFDLISASLMMHYIEDWASVFRKFASWLTPNGRFVFSTHHPIGDFPSSPSGIYYQTELIREPWPSMKVEMVNFRRAFSTMFNEITEGGFQIKGIVEPQPVPELENINPDAFRKLSAVPPFICFNCVLR